MCRHEHILNIRRFSTAYICTTPEITTWSSTSQHILYCSIFSGRNNSFFFTSSWHYYYCHNEFQITFGISTARSWAHTKLNSLQWILIIYKLLLIKKNCKRLEHEKMKWYFNCCSAKIPNFDKVESYKWFTQSVTTNPRSVLTDTKQNSPSKTTVKVKDI